MLKINYTATVPAGVWQGWHKALGSKPTAEHIATAHAFVVRQFGLEGFAGIACALRPQGVTVAQQRAISLLWSQATGQAPSTGAHQNKVRTLIAGGVFNDLRTSKGAPLAISLTDKGREQVERYLGSAAHDRVLARQAVAKAKAAPAKAPKAKPVKVVTEPVAPPAPAMLDGSGEQATA